MDFINIYNPTRKAIHICNSHEPMLDLKLQKKYVLPTHGENKTCSKFERKIYGNDGKPAPNKGYTQCGKITKLKLFYYI